MKEKLSLLWKFNKIDDLESDIFKALERWEQRPELKDYLPEVLILPLSLKDVIKLEEIITLPIRFEKTVQDLHFMIEGTKYR